MKWQIQPEFLSSLYLIPNSSPFPLLRGWPGVDSGGGVGVRVHSSLYQENPGSTSCGCCAGARVSYFIFKRRGHIPFIQAFEPIYFNTPHVRGGSRTCTREGGGGKQFPQCCVTIIVFVLYNTCSLYDCCASISYTNRRPTTNHNSEHDLKTTCSPNPLYLRETLNRFFYNLIIHNKSSRSQFVFLFSLSIKHF